MLKKKVVLFFLLYTIILCAQKGSPDFKNNVELLKKKDNLSEYIYVHLDEYAKDASVKNLAIFENVFLNLWRLPTSKNEITAQLYLHINYAFYLKRFGFVNQSIIEYEKAYEVYTKNKVLNYNIIEYCLKPLANNYIRLGDTDRAEDILKITIEKAQKEGEKAQLISGYSNLAIVYRTKGAYTNAINYLNLGLELSDNPQIKSRLYSDLAINYLFLEEIEQAKENIQLSTKLNIENDISITTRNNITLGNYFLEKNKFNSALSAFEAALKSAKDIFGKNDREVAKIYNRIAEVYLEKQQFELALRTFQQSLQTLLPKYNPITILENPLATFFYPENTLKETLDGRANAFIQANNYKAALAAYNLAFKVEDELRSTYLTQNAKLIQQQENRNRSENCIELCYDLFKETNHINWIEKAFQYAEQSKAVVLLEEKEASFLKSTIKNDTLLMLEKELLFKQAQLNKNIAIEELKGEKAVINLLANLINQRSEIATKIQLLKVEIHKKYPHLTILKDSLLTVKGLKEKLLNKNEVLVEFFDGKRDVYVFSISKNNPIKLKKIEKSKVFKDQVTEFLNLFSSQRGVALQNNIQKYTSLGYQLYLRLLNVETAENMIIIPDGLFSFMPFDALITEETSVTNFEKLPYLLRKSRISFGYSATILMQQTKEIKINPEKFIGFFPVFENNHRGLSALKNTLQEAKSIENTIEGNFLLNSNASKNNFNAYAENYSIIHLSTHATAGNFYEPPAIEFYNETLYLPEIYGYNLQADLLVLSACETGLGTLRKGEGAMSLARGFSYAGVKNLLVSLWKVNDKSTEELMAEFYKNYKKTESKSVALHHSKLAYIENKTISVSKKSPYYWASFVYIGDTTSNQNNDFNFMWFLILGFSLLGGYFLFKKR